MSATTYFTIESNMLHTYTRFDHDSISPGPTISAIIKCEVLNRFQNQVAVQEKLLRINVLDRNDNPPEIQAEEDVYIHLEDPHFRKVFNFLFNFKLCERLISIKGMISKLHE